VRFFARPSSLRRRHRIACVYNDYYELTTADCAAVACVQGRPLACKETLSTGLMINHRPALTNLVAGWPPGTVPVHGRTGPPGTCQVGRLVRRPCGPPRQILEYVKRLTPLTGKVRVGMEGEKGAMGRVTEGDREGGRSPGTLSSGKTGRGHYFDICLGVPEFLIMPLLMGPVCLLSQPH